MFFSNSRWKLINMPIIDDFVTKLRKNFFARNFNVGEFDNDTVKEAIDGALEDYSRYKSRKARRGNVNLVSGEYYINLPSDFMQASMDQIMFIVTGNTSTSYNWNTNSHRGRNILSVFDSALGATQDPPPSIFYGYFTNTPDGLVNSTNSGAMNSIQLTSGDTGTYQLALSSALTETLTRTIVYDAFHVIDDTKNTVPIPDQGIIMNLALSNLCSTLATDLLSKPNSIKDYTVANQYSNLSKEYRKTALSKLRNYGFMG